MSFRFVAHPADIKCIVRAPSEKQLFEEVTRAISYYLAGGVSVRKRKTMTIRVEGHDVPSLLYAFMDALIYAVDAKQFIPARAHVTVSKTSSKHQITARLAGDITRDYALKQIKAATYADMKIGKTKTGWRAQFVLDV